MCDRQLLRKVVGVCLTLALIGQSWAQDAGEATGDGVTIAELKKLIEEQDKRLDSIEKAGKPKPITQKWTGRMHVDYWGFPDESPLVNFLETGDPLEQPGDFIGFRRLRFGVAGQIYETMEYKIEMEWAMPEDPTFKDAYFGWNDLPYLRTLLMGNQKRPYGLDHLNSSRYNVFMERPFHVDAFNQDNRRVGVCSYGLSENESWNWRWGYFIMDDLQRVGSQRTDNYQSELCGRLANTIWYDEVSDGRGYAHWAVSGSMAFPGGGPDGRFTTRPEARSDRRWIDTGELDANRYGLLGVESVINVGALQIVSEYQISEATRFNAPNVTFDGYYVYVAYFLTGEHMPWERSSGTLGRIVPFENFFLVERCTGGCGGGWGAWQIAARYSHGDFSDEDVLGGVGDSVTFGLNWYWTPNSRMQFNYIHGRLEDRDPATTGGNPLPIGVATAGDYDIFGARFMVDF
jgi:phosphate-selective porin OprO/OprP